MPLSRSKSLALAAVDACVAAIEVYNKLDFKHREETFSILMVSEECANYLQNAGYASVK